MENNFNVKVIDMEEINKKHKKNQQLHATNQVFTFVCGVQLLTIPVLLFPGQFVDIRCDFGPIVIRVGCGNQFRQRVATFNLVTGQAVQVSCVG